MRFEHAYHLTCYDKTGDPVTLFIGDEVLVSLEDKAVVGIISAIGPKGIFLDRKGLKNPTWYNFEKVLSIYKYVRED